MAAKSATAVPPAAGQVLNESYKKLVPNINQYDPKRWLEMRKTMSFPEMVEAHSKSIESVISTEEFREILSNLDSVTVYPDGHPKRSTNAERLYKYTVNGISELTSTDYKCPNLKLYYQQLFTSSASS